MKSTVLIVDDDNDILEILGYVTQSLGIVTVLRDDLPSVSEIELMQPGLIILDHWVKNGRGGQICREIKQHELLNHIPIILLSAVNELDEIARESCADHYLKKPFDLDSIIYVIEHDSKV